MCRVMGASINVSGKKQDDALNRGNTQATAGKNILKKKKCKIKKYHKNQNNYHEKGKISIEIKKNYLEKKQNKTHKYIKK